MKKTLFLCVALLCATLTGAKVTLPQIFQSGMVLQRGKPIPVWGKADAGETVTLRFNRKTYTTTADDQGHWRIDLPKMKAGGPYTLEVISEGVVSDKLDDILVGDVWLCSGQSNIDVTIERVYPQYPQEIDSYENPQIRLFRVVNDTDTHGVKDDILPTAINWKPLSRENAWQFSAVGYFLGKRMHAKTGVPQGIIVNSWGGTPIEAWISADSLRQDYPLLIEKTRLYQDDEMVKAQRQANQRADQQWRKVLDDIDPGISGHFTATDCDDSQWPTVSQWDNSRWALDTNGRGLIGSIWLRQHISIDKAHAGQPARLLLGTLFDADFTYVNGQEVGRTYYQYPPRRYDIPEGLLREGDNVITVRFINKYGIAHFIEQKPYLLAFGDDRCSQNPLPQDILPLSDQWRYHAGGEMPPCPSGDVSLQNLPTTLYNAVLHPLAPFALNGIVWYQGESNTGNPTPYADLLKRMMGCWRDRWQEPQLPFVIVQLANFMAPSEQPQNSNWARLREAQRLVAKADPRAELAVINDLGEAVDIHPLRKKEVAERIGLCFDRLIYSNKVELSPEVVSGGGLKVEGGGRIVLTLDQPIQPGAIHGFEIAGPDGVFHNAEASADGNRITILPPPSTLHLPLGSAASLREEPSTLRYAWKDNPVEANVRSLSGLPMSSFELVINRK